MMKTPIRFTHAAPTLRPSPARSAARTVFRTAFRTGALALAVLAMVSPRPAAAELVCWQLDPFEDVMVARVQGFGLPFFTFDGYLSAAGGGMGEAEAYQLPLSGTIAPMNYEIFGDAGLLLGADATNDFELAFLGWRQCALTARFDGLPLDAGTFKLTCGDGGGSFAAEGTMIQTECDLIFGPL